MNTDPRKRRFLRLLLVPAVGCCVGTLAQAQDFSIDWHTIDGGGEIQSETADQQWQLSGTIGQPDATELIDLSGSGWTLTGGFWAVNIDQTDILLRDGFEGAEPSTR